MAVVASINALEGYPRKAAFGGRELFRELECDAWLAGNRQGDPPPGIDVEWDAAVEHWDQPGNYSVRVAPRHIPELVGSVQGGRRIVRADMRVRTYAENLAWVRPRG